MSRHQSNSSSRRRAQDILPLPPNFISISKLLDDSPSPGKPVNVIGVVKDCKLPIPTRGKDFKSTLTLYDLSTQGDAEGIDLNVFRPADEIPQVEAGDVVVVFMAKHQTFGGSSSLLTSYRTDIHVYAAQKILRCASSQSAQGALQKSPCRVNRDPGDKENEYVAWLYDAIDKQYIPDQEAFAAQAAQSTNIMDRFSVLADVRDRKFADLVVQVVREPFDLGDKVCLWVSDWTENPSFFHRTYNSSEWTDGQPVRDGDPYGYTSKFKKSSNSGVAEGKWIGPLGKRSIQLTCWEPHADFIRNNVEIGAWIHLRKVQIGYGNNSTNIEGFLRGERDTSRFLGKNNVRILDPHTDRTTMDSRLHDAIRRKRDYEKEMKVNRNEEPRQRDNTSSKFRRSVKRAAKMKALKAEEERESERQQIPGLNDLIKCENPDTNSRPLSAILEPVIYHATITNEAVSLVLPFTCAKDRTHARVIDFHPSSLEDFAVSRRRTENDCLSDNSADDIDPDSDEDSGPLRGRYQRVWEWRFALKLEEVSPSLLKKGKTPATVWVHVGNLQAQLLTGLDAQDLRAEENAEHLSKLREQMFKLWGDLEERKVDLEARKRETRERVLQRLPPLGSDAEEEDATRYVQGLSQTSNKPFTCCIQQYGVKVEAEDEEEANAGHGKKWQRIYGLFGTKIASD